MNTKFASKRSVTMLGSFGKITGSCFALQLAHHWTLMVIERHLLL